MATKMAALQIEQAIFRTYRSELVVGPFLELGSSGVQHGSAVIERCHFSYLPLGGCGMPILAELSLSCVQKWQRCKSSAVISYLRLRVRGWPVCRAEFVRRPKRQRCNQISYPPRSELVVGLQAELSSLRILNGT